MKITKIIKYIKSAGFVTGFASFLFFATTNLYALPQGGVVSGGNVTISNPNATTTQINQASQKGIVDWQSYNVGQHEQVHYQQPNASSITLNRINPNNGPAQIYGSITANGQVWLVNPAGVWFGPTAHVDVGGLIASTANIRNEDFMAGQYHFTQSPDWHGAVINEGYIKTSQAGIVALVGSGVVNNGYIESQMGTVVLAAGSEFTVNFSGNELVSFTVDKEVAQPALDKNGNPLKDGVKNSGMIIADGGKVLMTAKAASHVLDNAINMSGVVEAKSVGMQNGEIILGAPGEKITVSGKLIASGKNAGEKGGKIHVLGRRIDLTDQAVLDVSGDKGGGEILVGGDAQGANPLISNAMSVYVAHDVLLYADAITFGDGGRVVVWADSDTLFYGSISARGGPQGGNGGWIETSGKLYLDVATARITTLAPQGITGTWLLDPTNIYIAVDQAAATSAGMTGTNTVTNSNNTFSASGVVKDSLLTTSVLTTALASNNIIVTTENSSGTGVGTITVVSPITFSSATSLTLRADQHIFINAGITMNNAGASLILDAGNTINASGGISGTGSVNLLGGTMAIASTLTYSGSTTINGGSINFFNSGSLPNSNAISINSGGALQLTNTIIAMERISDSATLTLNGGGFSMIGSASALTENIGSLVANDFSSAISLTPTSSTLILQFGSYTPSSNAMVAFFGVPTANAAPSNASGNIRFTTPPTTGNGQLVGGGALGTTSAPIMPSAVGYSASAVLGLVTYDSTGGNPGIRLLTASEYATNVITAGTNALITGTTTVNVPASIGINSLFFTGTTPTVNLSAIAVALSLTSGLLVVNSSTTPTISGAADASRRLDSPTTMRFYNGASSVLDIESGMVVDNNNFVKSGSGTTRFDVLVKAISVNSIIQDGSLTWLIANAIGDTTTSVTVQSSATLDMNNFNQTLSSITLYPGATVTTGTGTLTLSSTGTAITLSNIGSGLTGTSISGNLSLANTTLSIADANETDDLLISAVISAGTLTKTGTGTLVFSGTNTYAGTTAINAGVLKIKNSAGLGSSGAGTTVASGAALELEGSLSNIPETISVTGAGVASGGAIRNISGTSNITNAITLTGASTFASDAGTLTFTGGALSGSSQALTISGAGNIVMNSLPATISTLTKNGTGTLTLQASNAYTGITSINAGVIVAQTNNALGATGAGTTIASGAGLQISGSGLVIPETISSVSGTGASSDGAIRNLANNNTLSGTIAISTSAVITSDANTLTLSNTITGGSVTFDGSGNITVSNIINIGSNSLTKLGSGILTLFGANSYSGSTTISQGTLRLGAAGVIPDASDVSLANTSGASLDLNNFSETIGSLSGGGGLGGNITLGTGTLTVNQTTLGTYAGQISGSGGLIKAGSSTLTLSGANGYTGTTTINAGSLQLGASDVIADTSDVTLADVASAVFDLNGFNETIRNLSGGGSVGGNISLGSGTLTINDNSTNTYAGQISGSGNFTKAGTGDLTLSSATSNYTGNTNVTSGSLTITDLSALGTSAGSTTVGNATLTFSVAGTLAEPLILADGGTIISNNTGTLTLSGGLVLASGGATLYLQNALSGTLDISGVISGGTGSALLLQNNGTSTTIFSGNNTYDATTTMLLGKLRVTNNNSLGSTAGNTIIDDFGTIEINGSGLNIAESFSGIGIGGTHFIENVANNNTLSGVINGYQGVIKSSSGTLTLSGGIVSAVSVTIDGAGDVIMQTNPMTSGFLGKLGSGTLIIDVANSYSNGTTIYSGIIDLRNASGLGNSAGFLNMQSGATLQLNGATDMLILNPLQINGTGVGGTGAIRNMANNNTIGGSGITLVGDATINVSGGTLAITANITGTTQTLSIDGSGNTTINTNGINTGTGGLIKNGSGVLLLNAASSYTGTTTINTGTVRLGASDRISNSSNLTLANDATAFFDLNGFNETIANLSGGGTTGGNITLGAGTLTVTQSVNNTYAGSISGSGGLSKLGSAILTLSGASAYTGTTNIGAGAIEATNNTSLGTAAGNTTIASGAALRISGNVSIAEPLSITGIGITNSGVIRNISGNNTLSGAITLSGLSRINSDANTLTLTGGITSAGLLLTVGGSGNTTVSTNGINTTTGGLTKDGSGVLLLNAAIASTGITTINAGTLRLGAVNLITNSADVTLTNAAGALFDINNFDQTIGTLSGGGNLGGDINLGNAELTINQASNKTYAGIISGIGGDFVKAGSGTLSLSGVNTYTGTTNINVGKISVLNAGALGGSNSISIASGAALDIGVSSLSSTNTINLNGTGISNTGALVLSANNTTINNPIVLKSDSKIGSTNSGTMTFGGTITGTNTTLTINLSNAAISLPDITFTTSGGLSVTTNGAIAQTGVFTIPGVSSFTAGSNTIDLGLNNAFTGAVALSNSGANNVSVNNTIQLMMGLVNVGQDLTLTSSSSIAQNSTISSGLLTTSSATGTILNGANTVSGFNATNTGSGNISLTNTTATLDIAGISQSNSGNVSITNTGAMDVNAVVTLDTGSIALTTLSSDSNERDLTINNTITTNNGDIILNAANNSTGTATPLSILANLDTGTFTPSATGVYTIGGGISFGPSVTTEVGDGDISLQGNAKDITLGATSYAQANSVVISVNESINITGNISAIGNLGFVGDNLNTGTGGVAIADGVSITANGTLTFSGPLSLGNNIALNASNGTTVADATTLTGSNLTANNATFNDVVTLSNDTTINTNNTNIAFNNGIQAGLNDLALNTGANDITFGGTSTLHDLSISDTANFTNNGTINANSLSLSNGNNIFLGYSTLNATGGVSIIGGNVTGRTNAGSLFINVGTANLIGTINGASGKAAALLVSFIGNTPGTLFFNGFDLVLLHIPSTATTATTATTVPLSAISALPGIIASYGSGATTPGTSPVSIIISGGGTSGLPIFDPSVFGTSPALGVSLLGASASSMASFLGLAYPGTTTSSLLLGLGLVYPGTAASVLLGTSSLLTTLNGVSQLFYSLTQAEGFPYNPLRGIPTNPLENYMPVSTMTGAGTQLMNSPVTASALILLILLIVYGLLSYIHQRFKNK